VHVSAIHCIVNDARCKMQKVNIGVREVHDYCHCQPFTVRAHRSDYDLEKSVPISEGLRLQLCERLGEALASGQPFSVLLIHVVQLEQICVDGDGISDRRCRYHAPDDVLAQILANVKRVIRAADQICVYAAAGAVVILPRVDRWGMQSILERVYNSISLLQPETILPPLTHETVISIGVASYPVPSTSLEELLMSSSVIARALTMRPAITAQLQAVKVSSEVPMLWGEVEDKQVSRVPFMELPRNLPKRLKQLLPHEVAQKLRCVPVGKEQRCLTVAMLNPQDNDKVRRLGELTGMSIFPVSCKEEDLNALLERKW